jgi:putative membrane protein
MAAFGSILLISGALAQDQTPPRTQDQTPARTQDKTGSKAQDKTSTSSQDRTGQDKQNAGAANRMTASDSTFATKAAEGGLAEVQLGNLAKEHAASADVKTFAERMVTDHTKANEELTKIVGGKGITLPTSMNSKDQATYDRLAKLNGAAFDHAYMASMVSDHRTDVNEFKHEADKGTDSDLKSFAAKTLPTLQEHLTMAQNTETKVKSETKGKGEK